MLKNKLVRIFCVILAASVLFGSFSASAEERKSDGHITVETVTAVNGDSVLIRFKITENPGIMAMTISITYDSSALTYEKYYRGFLTDYTVADHPEQNLIRFVNCQSSDVNRNAYFLGLQFKVKEDADFGFYPINIEYQAGDFCNWKLDKLMPEITPGGVNIEYNGKNCSHKKYGEWEVGAEPSCLENGMDRRFCVKCGHCDMRETKPVGHSFSDTWTVDKPATAESAGTMSRHCIRCDATTDLLTFTLPEAEESGIENSVLEEIKPSDFTDRLTTEQLPEGISQPDSPSAAPDVNTDNGGTLTGSISATSGSVLEKIVSALPLKIKKLESLFVIMLPLLLRMIIL